MPHLSLWFRWFWCKVKKCLTKAQDDDLVVPEDVLLHIFTRLPIKAIGRCMCVTKQWHSLLKSPSFVSLYHRNSIERTRYLFLWKTECLLEFYLDNHTLDEYKCYTIPCNSVYNFPFANCIEICNGLICFACRSPQTIVLWNPPIRKLLFLPEPPFAYIPPLCFQHLGFAFDSLTNDYKVVSIHRYTERSRQSRLEVFSLNHNSWKCGPCEIDANYSLVEKPPPAFNGALHWIAKDEIGIIPTASYVIFGFDVHAETFRKIQFPAASRISRPRGVEWRVKLVVYKESSLGVLCEDGFVKDVDVQLWVMKDYGDVDSWTMIWKFCPFQWSSFRYARMEEDEGVKKMIYRKVYAGAFPGHNQTLISDLRAEQDLDLADAKRLLASHLLRPFQESLALLDNVNAEKVRLSSSNCKLLMGTFFDMATYNFSC